MCKQNSSSSAVRLVCVTFQNWVFMLYFFFVTYRGFDDPDSRADR